MDRDLAVGNEILYENSNPRGRGMARTCAVIGQTLKFTIMFKVLCINNNFFPADARTLAYRGKRPYHCPEYLGEYTVVKEDIEDGEVEYELAEFPPCKDGAFFWDAEAFVRLGGPNEIAIAEARIEADVKELDTELAKIVHEAEKV